MNQPTYYCLDFRREKLADPKRLSPTAETHVASCELCQAFARRLDSFDGQVANVLAVAIPEGLAERVILRVQTGGKAKVWPQRWQGQWHPGRRLIAVAASIFLVVALASYFSGNPFAHRNPGAVMTAVNHVLQEPESFTTHLNDSPGEFKSVLAGFGGDLQAPVGDVRYIRLCPIEGYGQGWHIVYQTAQGMVTLLLIPSKDSTVQSTTVTVDGMNVKVQRAGEGFYALIANTMPGLEAADAMLNKNVRWKT